MALRVLLTNFMLSGRTGSELYVCELATALLARGHHPIVYAPSLGPLAQTLRAATIPVTSDLSTITAAPDIIHGHHNHEIMTALLHFPTVPAIRVCHGWSDERPQPFPRILRVLCVDHTVRDRAVAEWGVEESRVQVLLNFVDLARFKPRGALASTPARALIFSNAAARHLADVRRACATLGIHVDAIGASVGASDRPEALLGQYDVVFAKARCALEALAVGTAVVLCDESGIGPLVTTANVEELRRLNFGVRTLRRPVSADAILQELANYDAADAAMVSAGIRAAAGLDLATTAILDIYEQVIREHRESGPSDARDELRAAAAYLHACESSLRTTDTTRAHVFRLLRHLYYRCEHVSVLRPLLPSRASARRLGSKLYHS